MWQLLPISADLVVEGRDETRGVGDFRGRALALAVRPSDDDQPPDPAATWVLVADDSKPAPVWVGLGDVTAQRLGR